MKNILILNGSPRRNGQTASLVNAFADGARAEGNEVRELYLYGMEIRDCVGCTRCVENPGEMPNPCVIRDDMAQVYEGIDWSDVVVLASPMFYWTITGQLKSAIDRTLALNMKLGFEGFRKQVALIMTASGDDYSVATAWLMGFNQVLGWDIIGTVLGAGKEEEARELGASIQ